MPSSLADEHRMLILRFVSQHSPHGRSFSLDRLPGNALDFPGVDLGFGLVALAAEGLCGIEDPDLVWSTPRGLAAVEKGAAATSAAAKAERPRIG